MSCSNSMARLQVLQRNGVTLQRDLAALKLEVGSSALKADTKREGIEREISQLDQQLTEYEAKRALVIAAPADGTVTTVLAEEGQNAGTSTPLLSILPAGAQLQAELLVPSRSIGFIAREPDGGAALSAVSVSALRALSRPRDGDFEDADQPGRHHAAGPARMEPAYRVTVALESQSVSAYGQQVPLQAGMTIDADVLLDHRRLLEWIFDPLYSLTRRM